MRESRLVRIAKLAYHIAQQTLPTYSHPKKPTRLHLPPTRRLRDAQNLSQLHLL